MFHVNENFLKIPGSYLFAEIAQRVQRFRNSHPETELIRLGIGDVTQPLVPAVIDALHRGVEEMAHRETFKGYGPDYGYDFLIQAILKGDYESRGICLDRDELFISDGSKCDVGSIQELFSPDARIAVTDPVYPVYVDSNAMAGRAGDFTGDHWNRIVYLPCSAENGFVPEMPQEPVDVLYLCYPNNPTGTVLTREQLQHIVEWARKEHVLIIYDAAYRAYITTEGIPGSIYEIPGAEEVAIECCSFSKTAGFTGTRCAYMVIPHAVKGMDEKGRLVELNGLWKRRTSTKFNGVSYPVQCGAAAVFSPEGQVQIRKVIAGYMKNAAIIREGLTRRGYEVWGGKDAPYIWLKIPGHQTSWDFFDVLLEKAGVVGTPGSGFGPCGEGYFRLTAFNTEEATRAAMERFSRI